MTLSSWSAASRLPHVSLAQHVDTRRAGGGQERQAAGLRLRVATCSWAGDAPSSSRGWSSTAGSRPCAGQGGDARCLRAVRLPRSCSFVCRIPGQGPHVRYLTLPLVYCLLIPVLDFEEGDHGRWGEHICALCRPQACICHTTAAPHSTPGR